MAEKKEVLLVGLEYPNTMLSVTNLGDWDDEELKATQATSLLSRIRGRRQAIQSGSSVFPLAFSFTRSLFFCEDAKSQSSSAQDARGDENKVITEFTSKDIILSVSDPPYSPPCGPFSLFNLPLSLYQGFLLKRGSFRRNWKRRYFMLRRDIKSLVYYRSPDDLTQLGKPPSALLFPLFSFSSLFLRLHSAL